jgi:hypothetical protein
MESVDVPPWCGWRFESTVVIEVDYTASYLFPTRHAKLHYMAEINPIATRIDNLIERSESLRGYL